MEVATAAVVVAEVTAATLAAAATMATWWWPPLKLICMYAEMGRVQKEAGRANASEMPFEEALDFFMLCAKVSQKSLISQIFRRCRTLSKILTTHHQIFQSPTSKLGDHQNVERKMGKTNRKIRHFDGPLS